MEKYFFGVDIGATKSHALVADQNGRVIGFGQAGPGNYEGVGWQGLEDALKEITLQALKSAGIDRSQISASGFGVAGYDWPSERQPTLDKIALLGLSGPVEAVNDAVIGMIAGAPNGWGVAIIAGTGENCWGMDRNGKFGRMTGASILGEYGGASTIVHKAVTAVAKEWGKRGPATQLSQMFMEKLGAGSLDELLEGIATGHMHYRSKYAPLVFQVAEAGDTVAVEVIRWAALELADMILGVVRQLNLEAEDFEVVMIGSVFKGGDLLIEPMKTAVQTVAPGASFVRLTAPPVVGGVLLGMQLVQHPFHALREDLIHSSQEYLSQNEPRS